MSRKSRNRENLELVHQQPLEDGIPPDRSTMHRLTGELHDTLEAIISGCALVVLGPTGVETLDAAGIDVLEIVDDLDNLDDVDDAVDEPIDPELDEDLELDADSDLAGDPYGQVVEATDALAQALIARVLGRDAPSLATLPRPCSFPLGRADRSAAFDEAAYTLREVGLERFDAMCDLTLGPDGTAELYTELLAPETAYVSLLEFILNRAESVAVAGHPLNVAERDALAWEFSRWSVSPPPGTPFPELAIFARPIREGEYSVVDHRMLTSGAAAISEFATEEAFAELFPRQHTLARALEASFVDVFECIALEGNRATLRSVRDGRTYAVHEHMDPIYYAVGWLCAGRLLPFADALHLRSPGMIFVKPTDADLARNAAAALEALGQTLPPALALEATISSVMFGVSVPRMKKPAPTRAGARATLDVLQAILADPEFTLATTGSTLGGFMAALAEQADAGGAARPAAQQSRRATKPKRRR